MSRTESAVPIFWNPRWASGFKRHTISSVPPGVSSAATVTAQAVAPNAKKTTNTFIPAGHRCDMERFYNAANQKYRGFHGTHCPTRLRMSRVPVFGSPPIVPNHQVPSRPFAAFLLPFLTSPFGMRKTAFQGFFIGVALGCLFGAVMAVLPERGSSKGQPATLSVNERTGKPQLHIKGKPEIK